MKLIGWVEWEYPKSVRLTEEEYAEAYQLVVEELRKNNYHFDGNYHQNGKKGCPIFDTGKLFAVSQREWGQVIADAFPEEFDGVNDEFNYLRWAFCPTSKNKNGEWVIDTSIVKIPE